MNTTLQKKLAFKVIHKNPSTKCKLFLLKSSRIKHLKHLKTLQIGIWVRNVKLVVSNCQDVRFAIFELGVLFKP